MGKEVSQRYRSQTCQGLEVSGKESELSKNQRPQKDLIYKANNVFYIEKFCLLADNEF